MILFDAFLQMHRTQECGPGSDDVIGMFPWHMGDATLILELLSTVVCISQPTRDLNISMHLFQSY